MTVNLVVIYTLSALAVLLVCVLSLYWIFSSRLEKENELFLVNNVLVLKKIIESQDKTTQESFREALNEEVILEPSVSHYYVRLVNEKGAVFMETPSMEQWVPISQFAVLTQKDLKHYPTKYWVSNNKDHHKKHFLLINASVNSNGKIGDHWQIQIAKDISTQWECIADFRRGLFIVLSLGVVGSALLGVIVTRKGLKPLREMTRSTERITVARLQERLDPACWPRELGILAVAFNEMLNRIEEGFTRLSQFSGDLAHELRTPITNLLGESEIILSRKRTHDEYREVLESGIEELSRLSSMIDDLLFLARVENPRAAIQVNTVDTKKIMKDICDFYEALSEEKGITLSYQGEGVVKADPAMVRRVMSNLVSNALKYSSEGKRVHLSTYRDIASTHIVVRDEGEGIAKEHLPHIFDRFYRVDSARSQYTGGTGLGLAIVKFIMDLHKGCVTIESELGQGTTICLVFPD